MIVTLLNISLFYSVIYDSSNSNSDHETSAVKLWLLTWENLKIMIFIKLINLLNVINNGLVYIGRLYGTHIKYYIRN